MSEKDHAPPPWMSDEIQFWSVVYIQAPRASVFEHLVKGELTKQYYLGMSISDPSGEGEDMWFGPSKEKAAIVGQVKAFKAPEKFCYTFRFPFFEDPASFVDFELFEESEDLTAIVVRHTGFGDRESETYRNICGGWPQILCGLKTLLETGKPMKAPESEDCNSE